MKRCPECRRDYYDETLLYCLDDGTRLLEGPAGGESATVILHSPEPALSMSGQQAAGTAGPTEILVSDSPIRAKEIRLFPKRRLWIASFVAVFSIVGFLAFSYYSSTDRGVQSTVVGNAKQGVRLYRQMSEDEQIKFISERTKTVQSSIGDEPSDLDQAATRAIKIEIDTYVQRKDSLSQKPFEEGLRTIYGRATQYAPLITEAYEVQKVPPALGLYQALIESEYRACPTHPHARGPVGLFQFSRKTAAEYGLTPNDYCDVRKQSAAAARHMSDLISDFGSEKSSWTLALLSFNDGAEQVRTQLRQMRSLGITERNFWAIRLYREPPSNTQGKEYVTRFFAAAIIGETPEAFELSTPPLTTLRPDN